MDNKKKSMKEEFTKEQIRYIERYMSAVELHDRFVGAKNRAEYYSDRTYENRDKLETSKRDFLHQFSVYREVVPEKKRKSLPRNNELEALFNIILKKHLKHLNLN